MSNATAPSRVFLTGASGFVGRAVLAELQRQQLAATALVHRRPIDSPDGQVRSVAASLFDSDALAAAMNGCSAVIHLIGIIAQRPGNGVTFQRMHVEATQAIVQAAQQAQIRRYVHMSAIGARPHAPAEYHRTKFAAEQIVRQSPLDWTILCPSMIHGPGGDFTQLLARWARGTAPPFLFMPYFGAGLFGRGRKSLLQPILVDDVARAFVDAISNPRTIGQVYELAGPDRVSWPQLHHIAADAFTGHRRATLAIPAWYANLLTRVVPAGWLPFNRDQVLMSQEDNVCDLKKFTDDFGWTPQPLDDSMRRYARWEKIAD